MKLYYFETINPQKACAVAKYVDAPADFVRVDLAKGEHKTPHYLAINPNGKVPALEDGDTKLWEANAIMCHLARKAKSDLWPSNPEKQIDVLKWLTWNSEHFTRHTGNLYFNYIIKPKFGLGEPDTKAVDESTGFFKQFAAVLDDHLAGRTFLLGDHLTVADFAVSVTLPYADRIQLPLDDFKNVVRWKSVLEEIPAWRDPFPAREAQAA
ncbi:glutathione S-transferase family protein [Pseudorhodoplanes sinuspersici]|uniref:Glutathione S-transferase n=1 Tax=Pseudorhodoplanes sinuspersici TaxID=1235591 RepID=A0A1W6ZQT4_9HYPH|nr:glutathione S-transferase family protein [Pseudorhodoplanes sinuspersici]ARP99731.1 glutathione S-transferase [Pseudorhodoplanes sinuspersici]RKE70720.1 glutathione S-transferase [Pseudorhodoplanes sinuspersici]